MRFDDNNMLIDVGIHLKQINVHGVRSWAAANHVLYTFLICA